MPKLLVFLNGLTAEWRWLLVKQCRKVRWQLVRRFKSEVEVQTMHGRLCIPTADSEISPGLFISRQYEYKLANQSVDFLKAQKYLAAEKPCVLYDIGANIGFISIGLLRSGRISSAVAFEPVPSNFRLLKTNIKLNGLDTKVMPFQMALSSSEGILQMSLSSENIGDHRIALSGTSETALENRKGTEEVQARTLDGLLQESEQHIPLPDIIWMDVQGHEYDVMLGGLKTFGTAGVPLVTEIWPAGIDRSCGIEKFTSLLQEVYTDYFILRPTGFIKYPIQHLHWLFHELGTEEGSYTNIILVPSRKEPS